MRAAAMAAAAALLLAAAGARAEDAPDPRTRNEALRTAQQVEREVGQAQLVRERRSFPACPPNGSTHERWRDADGITRRYAVEGGSGDSHVKLTHLYDRLGRLRLVIIEAAAVNGTRESVRLVYALDGSRLAETRRRVAGPGYAWPSPWPENAIVRNPDQAFASESRCGGPG
jgi:hypothetical protein